MPDFLTSLGECIISGHEEGALKNLDKALESGMEPSRIAMVLSEAMEKVGVLWSREEIFLPEVVYSADIFQECMDVLEPRLLDKETGEKLGHFVIGTVHGDLHDLGKNMVAMMLRTAGFNVHDLGKDVESETFIDKVKEFEGCFLGLSALLTTTMVEQKNVVDALKEAGVRDRVKVMVGGAPVTQGWAKEIGADAYAVNAHRAVEIARNLVREGASK